MMIDLFSVAQCGFQIVEIDSIIAVPIIVVCMALGTLMLSIGTTWIMKGVPLLK